MGSPIENHRYAKDVEAYRIGKRIAHARRAAGLTQRDLANKLGCVHQTLARYEAGELTLAVVTLLQIARILSVSAHQLIDEPSGADIAYSEPRRRGLTAGEG